LLDRRSLPRHDVNVTTASEPTMPRALRSGFRILFRLLAALTLSSALAAQAASVSKADTQKVREVIRSQLAAFAADDAKRAFSFAAPGIRQMFGTPERFLAMVREGYPVVYRPASVGFLQPAANGRVVIQAVEMADVDGLLWVAVYQLERQRGGAFRITGCEVSRSDGRVI
jgi:hypothetical protein